VWRLVLNSFCYIRTENCPEYCNKEKDIICRQVFDIPEQKAEITEFQSVVRKCTCCGIDVYASFPEGVTQQTQYGTKLKSLIVYLSCFQMLPQKRLCELIENQYGLRISQGMVNNTLKECAANLIPFNQNAFEILARSDVVGFDETGEYSGSYRVNPQPYIILLASQKRKRSNG